MKLHHFTGLRRLLGDEGLDAWSAALDEGDVPSALPYATPASILVGGLKPTRAEDFGWRSAFAASALVCVGSRPTPAKCPQQDYCTWNGWRITLVISSSDRKLVHWPRNIFASMGSNATPC